MRAVRRSRSSFFYCSLSSDSISGRHACCCCSCCLLLGRGAGLCCTESCAVKRCSRCNSFAPLYALCVLCSNLLGRPLLSMASEPFFALLEVRGKHFSSKTRNTAEKSRCQSTHRYLGRALTAPDLPISAAGTCTTNPRSIQALNASSEHLLLNSLHSKSFCATHACTTPGT